MTSMSCTSTALTAILFGVILFTDHMLGTAVDGAVHLPPMFFYFFWFRADSDLWDDALLTFDWNWTRN
ncbi:hypothetical protein CPB85DRAFT_1444935 [Mucidula mucida]|nr:hypothetical protein CPB85DRAFT_1444935 [Mucidula mucida]